MIGIKPQGFGQRLGNQMFQLAALVALAKDNNDDAVFPKWDYAQYFNGDFTPSDFSPSYSYKEYGVHEGKGFEYIPIPYTKGMGIYGYFQSEKHFISQEETIREMFKPERELDNRLSHKYLTRYVFSPDSSSSARRPTCAVHVRRGDYVKWPEHHPMIPAAWYHAVMNTTHFEDNTHFLIFSDDTEWCKANIGIPMNAYNQNHKITVVEGGTDIEDFTMQQYCDSNIIANSSFSWWAAWLNKGVKTVIAPKVWFGSALSEYDVSDLIPDSWEEM